MTYAGMRMDNANVNSGIVNCHGSADAYAYIVPMVHMVLLVLMVLLMVQTLLALVVRMSC